MPAINFVGVTDTPNNRSEMYFDGNKFSINFGLLIHIQNPNVLPIRLSDMNTTVRAIFLFIASHAHAHTKGGKKAYYPDSGSGQVEIGGGFMDYENVPAHADFNFTYPFALEFEPNTGTDQTLMRTLLDKCGLTGGQPQDLTIDYTIHLTAKVLFITVHPTISSSTSFVCPLKNVKYNRTRFSLQLLLTSYAIGRRFTWINQRKSAFYQCRRTIIRLESQS